MPAPRMLFNHARHESLRSIAWDADAARASIQNMVDDAESQFDPVHFWPAHPRDRKADAPSTVGLTPLYHGACGAAWALHYLLDVGAAKLQRDYIPYLDAARSHNQAWLGEVADAAAASYMMGHTPFLMMQWSRARDSADLEDRLARLITGNMDHPHRELMWGAPGTLLAALFIQTWTACTALWRRPLC